MEETINYGRQTIEEDDIASVVEVLRSGLITQGPLAGEFERAIRDYTGARYAVVCSSGTAALHLAHLAAGIGPGHRVATSPVTFLASANASLYTGAAPVFVDVEPGTGNIDPDLVEGLVRKTPSVRAVVPVHFAGRPCRMEELAGAVRGRDVVVIEDACHALGTSWTDSSGTDHRVGDCSHSDMAVFSFHPVKSITTGEGGAVTTNDETLYKRLLRFRNHGVTRDPAELTGAPAPWYYEMRDLGANYRLTDIQCALGVSQVKKLDRFIARRREIARAYSRLLGPHMAVRTPSETPRARSAWHLYPVLIDFATLGVDKARWFEAMTSRGVRPQVHYIPVHLQPYYRDRFGLGPGDFPRAEAFYAKEATLPIYPLLTDRDVSVVAGAVVESLADTTGTMRAGADVRPGEAGAA